MAETDLHRDLMVWNLEVLRQRYLGQRVYIASNLFVYYVEGDPKKVVAPDDFVVLDCDPGQRRTFRTWEEKRVPDTIFEITSRKTKREDQVTKPKKFAEMGVREYFLYDPTSDYLRPPLQGFRLHGGNYAAIEPDVGGYLHCQTLGIKLGLEENRLVMRDLQSGEVLRTRQEAAEQARDEAEQARRAAEQARRAAEKKAADSEEEIKRLRAQLARISTDMSEHN
jgi:Uma2 family endonuclease